MCGRIKIWKGWPPLLTRSSQSLPSRGRRQVIYVKATFLLLRTGWICFPPQMSNVTDTTFSDQVFAGLALRQSSHHSPRSTATASKSPPPPPVNDTSLKLDSADVAFPLLVIIPPRKCTRAASPAHSSKRMKPASGSMIEAMRTATTGFGIFSLTSKGIIKRRYLTGIADPAHLAIIFAPDLAYMHTDDSDKDGE